MSNDPRPTRSVIATLSCGCRLAYRDYPEWRIPQVGDESVWCYKHRDTQTVIAINPVDDGPSGKESEYGWS